MSRDYFSNIIEPRNFLNLDGINVKQIRDVVGKYVIEAEMVDHPVFCQKCSARIIKHGVREQTYGLRVSGFSAAPDGYVTKDQIQRR
jgi:hypothetical protein